MRGRERKREGDKVRGTEKIKGREQEGERESGWEREMVFVVKRLASKLISFCVLIRGS